MHKKQTLSTLVKQTITWLQIFLGIFCILLSLLILKTNSKTYSLGYQIQEQKVTQKNLVKTQEEIQNRILSNSSINNLKNKIQIIKMQENKQQEFIEGRYQNISKK